MKIFVLCVIANLLANCDSVQDCGIHTEDERFGFKLPDDLRVNIFDSDDGQTECLKNTIQNNPGRWHKAILNIGDGNTEITEKKFHDFLNALDGMDVITLFLDNVKLKDDDDSKGDGITLDNLRVLRINLKTENDCHTTEKLFKTLSTKNLGKLKVNTNTECEPEGVFEYATKTYKLDELRLTSRNSIIHSNDDRVELTKTDTVSEFTNDEMLKMWNITDREIGKLREIRVLNGNDANRLRHLLEDNKERLRKVDTNMDLRKVLDDTLCDKVTELILGGNEVNDKTLKKIQKVFPNLEDFCIFKDGGLTDEEEANIKKYLNNLKIIRVCKKV
jgi:hypothetical protein